MRRYLVVLCMPGSEQDSDARSALWFKKMEIFFVGQIALHIDIADKHHAGVTVASSGELYVTNVKHALNNGLFYLDVSDTLQADALLFYTGDDAMPALNIIIIDPELPCITVIDDCQYEQRGQQYIEYDLYSRHIKEERHQCQYQYGDERSHLV